MFEDKEPNSALALTNIPLPPANISEAPDAKTKLGIDDYDIQKKIAELSDLDHDRQLREQYSGRLYWMMVVYLFVVAYFLTFNSIVGSVFKMSDSVMITLLSTTTANMIGLFVFVARYIFYRK